MFVDKALANRNINQMEDINVAKQGERVLRNAGLKCGYVCNMKDVFEQTIA